MTPMNSYPSVHAVRVAAGLEQEGDDLGVAEGARVVQRNEASVVSSVHAGAY